MNAPPDPNTPAPKYEKRDISLRVLTLGAVLVVVLLVLAHFVVLAVYRRPVAPAGPPPSQVLLPPTAPVGPGLVVDGPTALRQLRAREEQVLTSYGWVDRDRGLVRIPITEALAQVASNGLPTTLGEVRP